MPVYKPNSLYSEKANSLRGDIGNWLMNARIGVGPSNPDDEGRLNYLAKGIANALPLETGPQDLAMPMVLKGKKVIPPEEYRGLHTAPMKDSGSPLHDLRGTYPEDIYGWKAAEYYGHYGQNNPMDRESISIIQGMKFHPDRPITIYRAVPKDAGANDINVGDWVTINRKYAKEHGESQFNGDYKIIKKHVRARDIFTNGDSIHEWGYDPQPFEPSATRNPDYLPGWMKKKMSEVQDE